MCELEDDMQELRAHDEERESLINTIEGDECSYCGGFLSHEPYKGNDAIVCDSCGTPTVQLW